MYLSSARSGIVSKFLAVVASGSSFSPLEGIFFFALTTLLLGKTNLISCKQDVHDKIWREICYYTSLVQLLTLCSHSPQLEHLRLVPFLFMICGLSSLGWTTSFFFSLFFLGLPGATFFIGGKGASCSVCSQYCSPLMGSKM